MKTGILWDLDGTLLDTLADLTDSVNYALAQFGCPPRTAEQVRSFVGNGVEMLIRRALPGKEIDPPVAQVLAAYQTHYKKNCQVKTRPYEGVCSALEQIGGRYPMAVVSNKPDYAVKLLCAEHFPGIYARGESEGCPRKPAPDMLIRAMAEIGVDTCIYVGDSEVDVQTAKRAGVTCLSVLWGFRDRETLAAAGAEYFCDRPENLVRTIEMMIARKGYGQ